MTEQWADIDGYEGRYQVSNLGRIKTIPHYVVTRGGKRLLSERIKKLGQHNAGYLSVMLGRNGSRLVHRIVAAAFLPKQEGKDFVNHKDGNKHNNRIDNLEWCSRQENEDHAFRTGLKNSTGSMNTMAKLTEESVGMIRHLVNIGFTAMEVAERFNVHAATIRRIAQNKIWCHI